MGPATARRLRADPMRTAVIDERRRARAAALAGLYAVTPDLADTAQLIASVEAALAGGAQAIQYRNKAGASPVFVALRFHRP